MNLTLIRSGNAIFTNVEYIGNAIKSAIAREKSALLQVNTICKAVLRSSFTLEFI